MQLFLIFLFAVVFADQEIPLAEPDVTAGTLFLPHENMVDHQKDEALPTITDDTVENEATTSKLSSADDALKDDDLSLITHGLTAGSGDEQETTTVDVIETTAMSNIEAATGDYINGVSADSDRNATLLPTVTSDTVGIRIGVLSKDQEDEAEQGGKSPVEDDVYDAMTAEEDTQAMIPGLPSMGGGGGDILSSLFGGAGFGGGGGGDGDDDYDDGNLKCFACDNCPETTDKMRKETCVDFSALCVVSFCKFDLYTFNN